MNHQDWDPVVLKKKRSPNTKNPQKTVVHTVGQKVDGGKNKQSQKPGRNADVDITDPDAVIKPVKTYDAEFRQKMQQARQEKNLSQKDLATRLNVKPNIIAEIEKGDGKWDAGLVRKMEAVLGPLRK